MKTILIYLVLLIDPGQGVLEVEITGIKFHTGSLRVGIYNTSETYLKAPYQFKDQPISASDKQLFIFHKIPFGEFAVSVYHDVNDNKILDSNLLRIPKEPYGFSNNPSSMFGPPSFKSALFNHYSAITKITIKL